MCLPVDYIPQFFNVSGVEIILHFFFVMGQSVHIADDVDFAAELHPPKSECAGQPRVSGPDDRHLSRVSFDLREGLRQNGDGQSLGHEETVFDLVERLRVEKLLSVLQLHLIEDKSDRRSQFAKQKK